MKIKIILLQLFVAGSIFAQPLQLRPEVWELYRLQALAQQSRILNSDDIIAKHEAFFNHPLFCEIAFGIEYIHLAEALLIQGKLEYAKKYFLKATTLQYISVSSQIMRIFNNVSDWLVFLFNRENEDVWDFVIPRTPENMRFKEATLEKILEIEKKQIMNPRIVAIANELREMVEIDLAVRIADRNPAFIGIFTPLEFCKADSIMALRLIELKRESLSMREVDSMNMYRLIELIKENPDIDVLRIQQKQHTVNSTPDAWIILLHSLRYKDLFARTAWTDFFEPYFRERAENGRGLDYCHWFDVYKWHIRQTIPYYGVYNPFGVLFEDEELKAINERRERVGLLPLVQETE